MNPPPDPLPPMVVVHNLADAIGVLDAGAGLPAVGLLSAASAAGFLGPAWWRALVAALERPEPPLVIDVLDCGSQAGRAMQAMRLGQRRLVVTPDCPQIAALRSRARPLGALLLPARPDALDLAVRGAERRLAAWLASPAGLG